MRHTQGSHAQTQWSQPQSAVRAACQSCPGSRTLTLLLSTRAISNISAPSLFSHTQKMPAPLTSQRTEASAGNPSPHCQPSLTSIHHLYSLLFSQALRSLTLLIFSLSCTRSHSSPEPTPVLSPPRHRGHSQQSCYFSAFTFWWPMTRTSFCTVQLL